MDSSFKEKLSSLFRDQIDEVAVSSVNNLLGEFLFISELERRRARNYMVSETQPTVLATKLRTLQFSDENQAPSQPPEENQASLQPSAAIQETLRPCGTKKLLPLETHLHEHNITKKFLMKRCFADEDEEVYFKCMDKLYSALMINTLQLNETLTVLKTPSSAGEFTSKLFGFLNVNQHQEVILADKSASIVCVYTDNRSLKIETFLNRLVYIRKCFFTAEKVCPQVIFDLDYCLAVSEFKVANLHLKPNCDTSSHLYLINKSHPMIMDDKKRIAVLLHVYVLDINAEYVLGMTDDLLMYVPQLKNGCVYKMASTVPIMNLKPFPKAEFRYIQFNGNAPHFKFLPNACIFVESPVKFQYASRYKELGIKETLSVISKRTKRTVSFTGTVQSVHINPGDSASSSRTGTFRGCYVPFFGNTLEYNTLSVLFSDDADESRTVKVYLNNWEHLARVKGLVKNMKLIVRHALVCGSYLKCCALTSFEAVQYLNFGLNISDIDPIDLTFDETASPLKSTKRKAEESPPKELKSKRFRVVVKGGIDAKTQCLYQPKRLHVISLEYRKCGTSILQTTLYNNFRKIYVHFFNVNLFSFFFKDCELDFVHNLAACSYKRLYFYYNLRDPCPKNCAACDNQPESDSSLSSISSGSLSCLYPSSTSCSSSSSSSDSDCPYYFESDSDVDSEIDPDYSSFCNDSTKWIKDLRQEASVGFDAKLIDYVRLKNQMDLWFNEYDTVEFICEKINDASKISKWKCLQIIAKPTLFFRRHRNTSMK